MGKNKVGIKEIAAELEIDLNEYYSILQDATGSRLFSFDDIMEGDDSAIESAAGEPLQTFPTRVARFWICCEPTRRAPSASAGKRSLMRLLACTSLIVTAAPI